MRVRPKIRSVEEQKKVFSWENRVRNQEGPRKRGKTPILASVNNALKNTDGNDRQQYGGRSGKKKLGPRIPVSLEKKGAGGRAIGWLYTTYPDPGDKTRGSGMEQVTPHDEPEKSVLKKIKREECGFLLNSKAEPKHRVGCLE